MAVDRAAHPQWMMAQMDAASERGEVAQDLVQWRKGYSPSSGNVNGMFLCVGIFGLSFPIWEMGAVASSY